MTSFENCTAMSFTFSILHFKNWYVDTLLVCNFVWFNEIKNTTGYQNTSIFLIKILFLLHWTTRLDNNFSSILKYSSQFQIVNLIWSLFSFLSASILCRISIQIWTIWEIESHKVYSYDDIWNMCFWKAVTLHTRL